MDETNASSVGELDPVIGQVLNDRYKVVEIIHRGRTNTIYKAVHVLMDRIVAIKLMAPQSASDAMNIKRFQHEAQAASHLSHPGVVTVYDFGFVGSGQVYLVMDYLDGPTLATVVEKDGPLSLSRFRDLFSIVGKAVSYAHNMGVIHRDLKPSNIVITKFDPDLITHNPLNLKRGDELPVIVDFRIAKLLPSSGRQSQNLTLTGEVLGTPLYMSPEQCMAAAVDARSDVYSLGCSMYFALTGEPPFQGSNKIETMEMHMTSQPNADRLPPEVRAIILQAMEKKPDDRIQSVDALIDLLGGGENVTADRKNVKRKSWWPY